MRHFCTVGEDVKALPTAGRLLEQSLKRAYCVGCRFAKLTARVGIYILNTEKLQSQIAHNAMCVTIYYRCHAYNSLRYHQERKR